MADTSKDELLLGGGMDSLRQVVLYLRHITATQAEVKEVPAWVRNCFNALIFGNISSACAKEYLIAATY